MKPLNKRRLAPLGGLTLLYIVGALSRDSHRTPTAFLGFGMESRGTVTGVSCDCDPRRLPRNSHRTPLLNPRDSQYVYESQRCPMGALRRCTTTPVPISRFADWAHHPEPIFGHGESDTASLTPPPPAGMAIRHFAFFVHRQVS